MLLKEIYNNFLYKILKSLYCFLKGYIWPKGMLKCADDTCAWGEVCNGQDDCADSSDEQNCKGS